jgi:hypothetical protein
VSFLSGILDVFLMTTSKPGRTISRRALFSTLSIVSSFLGFFVLLGVALLCTFAPLIYLISRLILRRRVTRPLRISQVTRQTVLISAWIIFNLLLRLLHSWSIFTAVVSFGIIMVIEFLALGRK